MIEDAQAAILVKAIQTLEKRIHELECERDNLKHANRIIVQSLVANLKFFNYSGVKIEEPVI